MQCWRTARNALVMASILTFVSLGGDARAETSAECANWLTAADVARVLGVELETAEPVEYSPGFTVCSWVRDRPEGQLGVNFSFFTPQAMREGMISAESIPEYFDLQVSSHRDTTSSEPQELAGVGKRAVVFSEEQLWIVMIELEDGFGHLALSPGDVTREQVEAVAKAVRRRASD